MQVGTVVKPFLGSSATLCSKEETKKSSGLLSLLSIDEDKDKDKNKLEIPLPPLFNEEKKNPENKNNESNVIKKSDDKTSKTSGVK